MLANRIELWEGNDDFYMNYQTRLLDNIKMDLQEVGGG